MAKVQLRKMHPTELIGRSLLLNDLRTVPVEMIEEVASDLIITVTYTDGENKKVEKTLDWEILFFETSTERLAFIMQHFKRKEAPKSPEELAKMEKEAKAFINSLAGSLGPTANNGPNNEEVVKATNFLEEPIVVPKIIV